MRSSKPTLIGFWRDCEERRREQLRLHYDSLMAIPHVEGKSNVMRDAQAAFVTEARHKLVHAQRMHAYFTNEYKEPSDEVSSSV